MKKLVGLIFLLFCLNINAEMIDETAEGYHIIGAKALEKGNFEKAEKYLKLASMFYPTYSHYYYNLANLYYVQSKFRLAEKYYKKAIEKDPNIIEYHMSIQNTYRYMNDFENILKHDFILIKLKINDSTIYNNTADTFMNLGKYEKATEFVNKAIELDKENPYAYATLAEINAFLGNNDKFFSYLKIALEYKIPIIDFLNNPPYDKFKNNLKFKEMIFNYYDTSVNELINLKKYQEAYNLSNNFLEKTNNIYAHYYILKIYYLISDRKNFEKHLENVLKMDKSILNLLDEEMKKNFINIKN